MAWKRRLRKSASAPLRSWSSARLALADVSLRRVAHDFLKTSFCRVHKKASSGESVVLGERLQETIPLLLLLLGSLQPRDPERL